MHEYQECSLNIINLRYFASQNKLIFLIFAAKISSYVFLLGLCIVAVSLFFAGLILIN